jgi:hypothetical protein
VNGQLHKGGEAEPNGAAEEDPLADFVHTELDPENETVG